MQTTYSQDPTAAYPGMPADTGFKDDISCVVEETNGIEPGLVVMRGTGGDKTARLPPAVAADADSLKTNIGTTAGVQTFTGADFEGAIGTGLISPPAKIDFILDSHTDWDATTATLIYEDENGVQQTESLSIPDGGNTTLTSTGYASRVVSLSIPAQTSTGGTATLGTSASVSLDGGDVLGVSVRTHKARQDFSSSDAENYEDEAAMPVRRKGRIYVEVENAFAAGDYPLVRVVAAGAEKLGAIRVGDTDGGDCVVWTKARLLTSGSAGALGLLEINQD